MQDNGSFGTASKFSPIFKPGTPIYAKQLNDIANGVQAGLPTPYTGVGTAVSYLPGGSIITTSFDPSASGAIPPFQVSVYKDGDDWKAQITKGYVIAQNISASVNTPSDDSLTLNGIFNAAYLVNQVAVYPSGSKTAGTDSNSNIMDNGGTITLPRGSTSDFYFCLIRNVFPNSNQSTNPGMIQGYPYFAVIQADTQADAATKPLGIALGGLTGDELKYFVNFVTASQTIPINPPTGSSFTANVTTQTTDGILHLKSFNYSRLILAKASWDAVSSSWSVTQYTNTDVVMPLSLIFNQIQILGSTPSFNPPDNMSYQDAWYADYSGYDKDFASATVRTEN